MAIEYTYNITDVSTFDQTLMEDTWDRSNINWCLICVTASVGFLILVHIVELCKKKAFISGEAEVLTFTRRHEYEMSHNPTLQNRNRNVPIQP